MDAEAGDLALVRINKSLPVAASKVRLARSEDFQGSRLAALVGYGKLGWAEETSPEQQWFAIVPIGSADCSRPGDQRNYGCHPPQEGQPIEMVTLDRLNSKHRDALPGDSGGPLILASHDAADLPRDPLIVAGVMSRKAEARAGGIRGEISVLLTNKNIVAWIESYGRS